VALAPISGAIWSYEQFQNFINNKVASNLKEVPPEDIITPKSSVAVPAIHALSYTLDEELLSDMYAKLLASSMDRKSANG
ncbi:Abi-alpha family protein, partial [Pseudomonas sp. SIMBA_065]